MKSLIIYYFSRRSRREEAVARRTKSRQVFMAAAIKSSTGANFWPGRTWEIVLCVCAKRSMERWRAALTSPARRKGEQQVGIVRDVVRGGSERAERESELPAKGKMHLETQWLQAETAARQSTNTPTCFGWKQKSTALNQVNSLRFTAKEWLSAWLAALFAAHTLWFINNDLPVRSIRPLLFIKSIHESGPPPTAYYIFFHSPGWSLKIQKIPALYLILP